jgi:hypothetical protein
MTNDDYQLMINICQYALRKGHDLNQKQIVDIDNLIKKINNRNSLNALVRSKKVGKTTGI